MTGVVSPRLDNVDVCDLIASVDKVENVPLSSSGELVKPIYTLRRYSCF